MADGLDTALNPSVRPRLHRQDRLPLHTSQSAVPNAGKQANQGEGWSPEGFIIQKKIDLPQIKVCVNAVYKLDLDLDL